MAGDGDHNAVRTDDKLECGGNVCGPCSGNVRTQGGDQARATDPVVCIEDHGKHYILTGSSTVYVNQRPAARLADVSACGSRVQAGASRVRIGGKCVRAPVGNREAALRACRAATKDHPKQQGSFTDCALRSAQQILNLLRAAQGLDPLKGKDLLDFAHSNNLIAPEALVRKNGYTGDYSDYGGMTDDQVVSLLSSNDPTIGVNAGAELVYATPADVEQLLPQYLEDGRGIVAWVNADGIDHAITVVGADFDADGKVKNFYVNDTGKTGSTGCYHRVPKDELIKSLLLSSFSSGPNAGIPLARMVVTNEVYKTTP